jgi:hypothetical protein
MQFIWIFFLFSFSSYAHQTSLTSGGKEMFWSNPSVPLAIRTNTNDLNSSQVMNVILDSMNQWNMSSSAKINSVSSSTNEIKFVANFPYGNAVLGVTELSYNSKGAIQKATILLNDDYRFHATPGLYPPMEAYLGDVVTHEMGHMFGLSHSEVLDSSMFHSTFSGQSTVSFDDQTGVRQKYEDYNYGKIYGKVKGGNDIGVLGTHVQAISRKSGKVTSVVSDETGFFELGGLDLEDTYYLYTSPIKNSNSLPGYFANTQNKFCPASYVGSFFSKCGREFEGKPQGVSLTVLQPEIDVGIVTINCDLKSDQYYSGQKINTTFNPVTIFTYDPGWPDSVEQAYVGWFRNPSISTWSTADVLIADFSQLLVNDLFVKVSLVSFPFGTQLEYQMDISNDTQNLVIGKKSLTYSSSTGTYNTDMEVFVPLTTNAGKNKFKISLKSRKLNSSYVAATFPSSSEFSSGTQLPYLLIVSLWQDEYGQLKPVINTKANLSDNASCLDAPFTYAVSKAQDKDSDSLASARGATAAACGTIDPPGGGPGPSLPLMTLGFALTLIASSVIKSRKKFLS